jgi:hypothetical protein
MDIIRRPAPAIWLLVLASSIFMAMALPFAGDAKVYENTVREVRSGISPYLSGIARLKTNHAMHSQKRTMNYIYPPMTLPLIGALGWTPAWLRISAFWLFYASAIWFLLHTEERFLYKGERRVFLCISPLCVFFPGLLNDDFLLAGNIGLILYGIVCAVALWDWKHRQWKWFYLAVLLAFFFKAPMLTLLSIPVLTAAGEWLKAAITGFIGCSLFLLQGWIWPGTLHDYLQMMALEGSYNREFGFGPAGILAKTLLYNGVPFQTGYFIFYLVSACAIFLLLLSGSRHYLAGRISTRDWMPVLLIGVILLNPRIKQYDAEAVTLPMVILAWRALAARTAAKSLWIALGLALFAVGNILAAVAEAYDLVEMVLMTSLFAYSFWRLRQKATRSQE